MAHPFLYYKTERKGESDGMDTAYVTKEVHDEFAKRIDEENDRQNKRLSLLEAGQSQITELVSTVKVLAVNMENMAKEQAKQGARLNEIEGKPGKRWETLVACVITCIVTAAFAYFFKG